MRTRNIAKMLYVQEDVTRDESRSLGKPEKAELIIVRGSSRKNCCFLLQIKNSGDAKVKASPLFFYGIGRMILISRYETIIN